MNELSVHVLRTKMKGDFLLPGDGRWFVALETSNIPAGHDAVAFARPQNAADVAALAEFARVNDLRIVDSDHEIGGVALAEPTKPRRSRRPVRWTRSVIAPLRIAPLRP